jgi:phosphate starvation-inducible membrane PsiE
VVLFTATRRATAWALAGTAFTAGLREVSNLSLVVVTWALVVLAFTDTDTLLCVVESF